MTNQISYLSDFPIDLQSWLVHQRVDLGEQIAYVWILILGAYSSQEEHQSDYFIQIKRSIFLLAAGTIALPSIIKLCVKCGQLLLFLVHLQRHLHLLLLLDMLLLYLLLLLHLLRLHISVHRCRRLLWHSLVSWTLLDNLRRSQLVTLRWHL